MSAKWNCFFEHVYNYHYKKIVDKYAEIASKWDAKEPFEPDSEPQPWNQDDFDFTAGWELAENYDEYKNEPEAPSQDDFYFAAEWSADKWKSFLEIIIFEYKDEIEEVLASIADRWEGPEKCGLCNDSEEQPLKKVRKSKNCSKCDCNQISYDGPCDCEKYSYLCEDCGGWGHDGLWYCGENECIPPNNDIYPLVIGS